MSTFLVDLPEFQGSLTELIVALRTGRVLPAAVPLLALTKDILFRAQGLQITEPDVAAELLPPLSKVIALKARLLLPQLHSDEFENEGDMDTFVDDVTESVGLLAQLDEIVSFLSTRRQARIGLIPASPLDLQLPRPERKKTKNGLSKLLKAAREAVREIQVPLLARERTTLRDALSALRAYAMGLKRFIFGNVTVENWGERTVYFAALLEGIKGGDFHAQQEKIYGPIEVEGIEK